MNALAHQTLSFAATVLGIWLALNAFSLLILDKAMFHPPAPSYKADAPGVLILRDAGGDIAAYWAEAKRPNGKTILLSHGNGEDFGNWLDRFAAFRRLGFNVFSYDYPGYGLSPGKPSEKEVYRAADAAYRHVTGALGVKPSDLILYGYSIGSGPACYLAERHPAGGLVFHSGFYSAVQTVTRRRILLPDPFPNGKRLCNIACPKLFLHGKRDGIVPFSQGRRAYEAARTPKERIWLDKATHYTVEESMGVAQYEEAILRFGTGRAVQKRKDEA